MFQIKLFWKFLREPQLLNPNVIVDDISKLDFRELKAKGINYVIFDKDQTLTKQDEFRFFNPDIENTIAKLKLIIPKDNIAILSNSNIQDFFDKCEDGLGIRTIRSTYKKPLNVKDILKHFSIDSHKLEECAVIGDRLMTDIALGNINGMLSIYCKPLDRKHDKISVKFLRPIEDYLLSHYFQNRKTHSKYKF